MPYKILTICVLYSKKGVTLLQSDKYEEKLYLMDERAAPVDGRAEQLQQ